MAVLAILVHKVGIVGSVGECGCLHFTRPREVRDAPRMAAAAFASIMPPRGVALLYCVCTNFSALLLRQAVCFEGPFFLGCKIFFFAFKLVFAP